MDNCTFNYENGGQCRTKTRSASGLCSMHARKVNYVKKEKFGCIHICKNGMACGKSTLSADKICGVHNEITAAHKVKARLDRMEKKRLEKEEAVVNVLGDDYRPTE